MTTSIADDLANLASMVQRLTPNFTDMRRFYEARSSIAADIRRLADQIDTPRRPRLGSITTTETAEARTWHASNRSAAR
jgi:hypothetical protein